METKPSSFGHGEHKVPVGLKQAVLPVLPLAFQAGRLPNSCGLWWSVAASTLDLVRDLGGDLWRAPPWSWDGVKGRVHRAVAVLRWMDMGCAVQAFQVQVRDTGYSCKEEQNQHLVLVQVAEGTKQVLRGRQPICKYPVSFPAYYAM